MCYSLNGRPPKNAYVAQSETTDNQGFSVSKEEYNELLQYRVSKQTSPQVASVAQTDTPIAGSSGDIVILVVYVDDIILTGNNLVEIAALKKFLDNEFKIKDLGLLHYFLGIEVSTSPDGVFLNRKKFILDLLKEYNYLEVSYVSPLDLNSKLKADSGELFVHPEMYKSLISKLLFLTHTRLDLCFGVQHLSQLLQAPRLPHMTAALHMLRYLKGIIDVGLFYFNSPDCTLTAYSDSDWAT
ncbi:uncharacterized mitochondrial protein AtMg00810-like [Nicotiana sylvestris]|uniref:uncharacterized mitochondrial protein AtMg00810-like n=1 Tax=Nicotiana sylvestris TaxID=4096 RepID=UPI00388CB9A3